MLIGEPIELLKQQQLDCSFSERWSITSRKWQESSWSGSLKDLLAIEKALK